MFDEHGIASLAVASLVARRILRLPRRTDAEKAAQQAAAEARRAAQLECDRPMIDAAAERRQRRAAKRLAHTNR